MSKKTKLVAGLLTFALAVPLFSVNAFATGVERGFYGYLLPQWQGANYTSTYEHSVDNGLIQAKVTKFTGASKCYLWGADISKTPVTSTATTFSASDTWKTLGFTDGKNHYLEYLQLGMMNYDSSSSGAYVDGSVNFN